MTGTRIGVLKQKAKRHGISVGELEEKYTQGLAWCYLCKSFLSVNSFGVDKSRSNGLASVCVTCRNHKSTAFRYGITITEARELRLGNRTCEICGRIQKLEVDHNHATGKVRGLLCSRCNGALGQFCDNVELLQKAIAYLEDRNNG
jgi:hypothetical protein